MLRALAVLYRDIARPWTAEEVSREVDLSRSVPPARPPRLATVGQDRGHPHHHLVVGIPYSTGSVLSALPPRAWESKPLGYKVLGLSRRALKNRVRE